MVVGEEDGFAVGVVAWGREGSVVAMLERVVGNRADSVGRRYIPVTTRRVVGNDMAGDGAALSWSIGEGSSWSEMALRR